MALRRRPVALTRTQHTRAHAHAHARVRTHKHGRTRTHKHTRTHTHTNARSLRTTLFLKKCEFLEGGFRESVREGGGATKSRHARSRGSSCKQLIT